MDGCLFWASANGAGNESLVGCCATSSELKRQRLIEQTDDCEQLLTDVKLKLMADTELSTT